MRKAAATLAIFCLAGMAFADEGGLQPYQMVRSLQLVQDRLANGDHAALPMQRKLLEMIDGRLRRADPSEFENENNYRALLVYAMSGGNPATMRQVAGDLSLDEDRMRLSGAVTNYVTGNVAEASQIFMTVEPLDHPPELGAFLALVKGAVMSSESPEKAATAFDEARLLGPGTLVEEAALRRLIALDAQLGKADAFQRAAIQYVTRFLRSPYATQFAEAYVAGIVKLHDSIDLESIEETVSHMNEEQAKVIYLRLARRSAIEGYSQLLSFASRMAAKWANPAEGKTDPRALLYASIGSVTSDNVGEVLEVLKTIDRAGLTADDRELLAAAEAIAAKVTASPPGLTREARPAPEIAAPATATAGAAEPAEQGPVATLLSGGRARIEAIDRMLMENDQ